MTTIEFEHIAEKLRLRVVKVGREFFADDDKAEDIAQEILTRLWIMRDRVNVQLGVEALAVRMAKNLCVSEWRRQKAHRTVPVDERMSVDNRPTAPVEAKDGEVVLNRALAGLTKSELRLYRMRHEADMDIQQISAATGIGARSVSAMLSTARRKLFETIKRGDYL